MESTCVCRFYQDLSYEERSKMLKDRLKKYSQKASPATCAQHVTLLLPVVGPTSVYCNLIHRCYVSLGTNHDGLLHMYHSAMHQDVQTVLHRLGAQHCLAHAKTFLGCDAGLQASARQANLRGP